MSGSDLFTGTLDILILRTVAAEPLHGYAIGKALREGSDGVLAVEEGALYPALHRLERRGWIRAQWGTTDNNRKAKYYELTGRGRRGLGEELESWRRFAQAVELVLAGG